AAREVTPKRPFLHVLQMDQFPARAVFLEELDRVLVGEDYPENIHLETDDLRIGLLHQQIEQSSLAVRLEFVAVAMIEKLQTMFRHDFAGLVEYGCGLTARLFVEVALVRYPGATGVLETQFFGFARDGFRVAPITAIIEMCADGLDTPRGQLLGKFSGREAIGAGQLGVLNPPTFHFIERAWDVFRELRPQAVELKANRPFETRPNACLGGGSQRRTVHDGGHGHHAGKEEHRFHATTSIMKRPGVEGRKLPRCCQLPAWLSVVCAGLCAPAAVNA